MRRRLRARRIRDLLEVELPLDPDWGALLLQCYYPHRSKRAPGAPKHRTLLPSPSALESSNARVIGFSLADREGSFASVRDGNDDVPEFHSFSWSDSDMTTDMTTLCNNWEGEFQAFGSSTPLSCSMSRPNGDLDVIPGSSGPMMSEFSDPGPSNDAATLWRAVIGSTPVPGTTSTQIDDQFQLDSLIPSESLDDKQSLKVFGKIMQPPAAMLMGGIKKWRHLQQYLMNLASQNDVVMSALLGLDKVLEWDSVRDSIVVSHDIQDIIMNSFYTTTCAIQQDLSQVKCSKVSSNMDDWLAAIFLLAWTHVLRDRVEYDSGCLFPTELADTIITYSHDWNWYSRQLLSWFNSLDSKASHLSGPTLLSSKALQVVSQYPIQIISCDYEESKYRRDSLGEDEDFQLLSQSPLSEVSEHGDSGIIVPAKSLCDVKEIILRAILQPAAEWYLKTQAYCRQISSLDKHHCNRFTPDAEIKISLEGKRIHSRLWDLWAQCPSVISLSTAELSMSVAPDVAMRVQEVSNVYLASFWILFVYLHRICWWHLPHTEAVTGALEKTWEHMKNSYGESDARMEEKTVHPSLMWPIFIFGAECKAGEQRIWAIQQLKALGKARPVLKSEAQSLENLPAFRISHGATRNAKRAALLLEALTRKQDETNCRVDERDLAMDIFNCYFSIV
ncbi:C6 finger domain-containing protein [Fusarium mexicanum]|uniref:C6 finger domain-containing protein n=1 Tax=Fusarium mexicanum TaxID=751941 RepID=A0A8H5MR05_9HYPO|nr:C6 finger domain-containing protein [Fusarium mexicanum]